MGVRGVLKARPEASRVPEVLPGFEEKLNILGRSKLELTSRHPKTLSGLPEPCLGGHYA
jgi:hypothetical protein